MASRTELVYNPHFSIDTIETFMYRHSRDVMNRLRLSRILEDARRLAGSKIPVYVSDVDSIIMQYRRINGTDTRRFIGFEFKNMRADVALKGSWLKVNGKQYETYMEFVKKTGIDVFYLIKVEGLRRYFYSWSVKRVPVRFEWLGKNETRDYYALIRKEHVAMLDEEDLPRYLRDIIFGKEV